MPSDLDQAVSNAIASGVSAPVDILAWLLRKSGLPGNYEKPVMGSDWMREKGLTKEVQPGGAQVVGETVGSLVDPLAPLSKAALAAKAAHAALYAGALRKDLLATTAVEPSKLARFGEVTPELTSPSLAITKNDIGRFNNRPLTLIAREGVFDPRTSNTTLHAFDAYTPRLNQIAAMPESRFETRRLQLEEQYAKHPELQAIAVQELLREQANRRLADRFLPVFQKGGRQSESMGVPTVRGLPEYGKGGFDSPLQPIGPNHPGFMGESYGPRFQSFKHYETSPYGAARLDSGPEADQVYNEIENTFKYYLGKNKNPTPENLMDTMWSAAQGHYGPDIEKRAHALYNQLKRTKSDYGELKAFGPVGLHAGNFPGAIITQPGNHAAEVVANVLRKRGIHVEDAPKDKGELFDMASWLAKGGPVSPLRTSLPTKSSKVVPPEPVIPVGTATEWPPVKAKATPTTTMPLVKHKSLDEHLATWTPEQLKALDAMYPNLGDKQEFLNIIHNSLKGPEVLTSVEKDFLHKHQIPSSMLDQLEP